MVDFASTTVLSSCLELSRLYLSLSRLYLSLSAAASSHCLPRSSHFLVVIIFSWLSFSRVSHPRVSHFGSHPRGSHFEKIVVSVFLYISRLICHCLRVEVFIKVTSVLVPFLVESSALISVYQHF